MRFSHRKRNSRSRTRRHKRGGSSWTSGTTYVGQNYGTEDMQYKNVFGPNPAPNAYGNYLIQPGGNMLPASVSSSASPLISGGRRHRRHTKRGGFLGKIVSQAIVPFGLSALALSRRRKHSSSKGTRRHR